MLPITLNRCVRSPPLFDLHAEAAEVLFRFLTLNIYDSIDNRDVIFVKLERIEMDTSATSGNQCRDF